MIKNYNDYTSDKYLSNERESLERELRARKLQRSNKKYDLEINLDLIIREIMYSISNDEDYVLSIGKRKEELEGTTETVFHIEFENEKLGRVRIFKPKDTATKGHYEVNGDYYETTATKIRDLYHTLNQEIKGNEMIVRTAITESVLDKMVAKSDEEIEKALLNIPIFDRIEQIKHEEIDASYMPSNKEIAEELIKGFDKPKNPKDRYSNDKFYFSNLSDFSITEYPEIKKISKILNKPLEELAIVEEEGEELLYDILKEFFKPMLNKENLISIDVENDETGLYGEWDCYTDIKVAWWNSSDMGNWNGAWIFTKEIIEKFI